MNENAPIKRHEKSRFSKNDSLRKANGQRFQYTRFHDMKADWIIKLYEELKIPIGTRTRPPHERLQQAAQRRADRIERQCKRFAYEARKQAREERKKAYEQRQQRRKQRQAK